MCTNAPIATHLSYPRTGTFQYLRKKIIAKNCYDGGDWRRHRSFLPTVALSLLALWLPAYLPVLATHSAMHWVSSLFEVAVNAINIQKKKGTYRCGPLAYGSIVATTLLTREKIEK